MTLQKDLVTLPLAGGPIMLQRGGPMTLQKSPNPGPMRLQTDICDSKAEPTMRQHRQPAMRQHGPPAHRAQFRDDYHLWCARGIKARF